jgi:hypothetical protein
MPLRHGKDKLRVETLQPDEQPIGLAVSVAVASGDDQPLEAVTINRSGGRVADRFAAAELGRRGGRARARRAAQLSVLVGLGLRGATPASLAPYLGDAIDFAASEVTRLALECGNGVCPQNACALVQQAALAMAGSRAAYAAGELALGAKLGVEVRQNLLGARELTIREAQAARPVNPRERWLVKPKDKK